MDSINIGWNKYSSDEVQFISNKQLFQRDLTYKIPNQGKKLLQKKVHFDCSTPIFKRQAFGNTQLNQSETSQRQRYDSEDYDHISSSSTDIFASQLPTIPDKLVFSARAIAITFIIIVSIILAVAIAVAVVFSAINTGQNSTSNTNQSSLLTVSATASTTVLTSSISIGSQNGAPCSSYTTINDPSRNILQTGFYGPCDNGSLFNTSNNGAWIRFIGSGGLIMASYPPGPNRCGGYVTLWFNGTLPTTLGAMSNGSICYSVDMSDSLLSCDSSVIYCIDGYYIYFLSPVVICNARYCTM